MKRRFVNAGFGGNISWSPRSTSVITIENELPLWIDRDYQYIPIIFAIPTRELPLVSLQPDHTFLVAYDAACLLYTLTEKEPENRKRILSLSLPTFLSIRLRMDRGDIIMLRHFFDGEPPPGKTHLQFLTEGILLFFFSSRRLPIIAKSPRGKEPKAYPLTTLLPVALTICELLVLLALREANRGRFQLRNRIFEILEDDIEFKEYFGRFDLNTGNRTRREPYRNAIVIYLVHRAFGEAWDEFNHPRLLEKKPEDVLREYHYRQKSKGVANLIKTAKRLYNADDFERLIKKWTGLYLGEPGAAAKTHLPDL